MIWPHVKAPTSGWAYSPLLTIFIDHVPENRWASVTQQAFGFSDAAELFVVLAGFSAVLAYGRYLDDSDKSGIGIRRIASRIGTIYLFHLGTLLLVGAILAFAAVLLNSSEQVQAMKFEKLLEGDVGTIISALLRIDQPRYFDILPLYVVLLAAFPLLYMLLRRSIMLGIAASVSLWLIVQLTSFNLLTADGEAGTSIHLPGNFSWFWAWQPPCNSERAPYQAHRS